MTTRSLSLTLLLLLVLGCTESEPVALEFRIAEEQAGPGLTEMTIKKSGERLYVHDAALLDQSHVQNAAVSTANGEPAIEVQFTAKGARVFEELTETHAGKMCAMIVNGELVSAPRIMETIRGGRAMITGHFTDAEAHRIADRLAGR